MRSSDNGRGLWWVAGIAAATLVLHFIFGNRYGFHRDELATLDDARHLAWGFVAYPPVTPFFAWLSLKLFGTSLVGFRFFAALADAGAIVMTGLMTRALGGKSGAQILAALAVAPFAIAAGSLMQYVSFDFFLWVLLAYFAIRLCQSDDPRWWLAIGGAIGFGMLTKYTMAFFVAGLVAGVLLSNLRVHLKSKWLWLGVACSLLIFAPNLLWQIRHHFISLDFLREIHERDVRIGRANGFLLGQLKLMFLALPLGLAGLWFYFFDTKGKLFRAIGWMYLVPLGLFVLARARDYYLAPAYPMLYAAGATFLAQFFVASRLRWPLGVLGGAALLLSAGMASAFFLPIAPVDSSWWKKIGSRNYDLREEIGWPDLVATVARVRETLPPNEQSRVGILAGNYGEAGAINLYGPAYNLPTAISGMNSFWARGYGDPPPEVLILVGFSRKFADRNFSSVEPAGEIENQFGVANEEATEHANIFICRGLRQSWADFWKNFRYYG